MLYIPLGLFLSTIPSFNNTCFSLSRSIPDLATDTLFIPIQIPINRTIHYAQTRFFCSARLHRETMDGGTVLSRRGKLNTSWFRIVRTRTDLFLLSSDSLLETFAIEICAMAQLVFSIELQTSYCMLELCQASSNALSIIRSLLLSVPFPVSTSLDRISSLTSLQRLSACS